MASNRRKKEFRFCVGSQDGKRSTVWKVWTSKSDSYVLSRMMGSSTKVSIHTSGDAQWSIQSEWFAKNRVGQKNQTRHIEKWKWTIPIASVATYVFRISIPQCELRNIESEEDLADVVFLSAPAPDQKCEIGLYISPAPIANAPILESGFIAALPLENNQSLVMFVNYFSLQDTELNQLEELKALAEISAPKAGIHLRPELRGTGFFVDANGVRGIIEFVPFVEKSHL